MRTNLKQIKETLNNWGYIRYNTMNAKPELFNNKGELLGTITFNTFCHIKNLEMFKESYTYQYFILNPTKRNNK